MSIQSPPCPSLVEAQSLVSSGQIKPSEMIAQSLARIAATEPLVKATVTLCADEAIQEATRLDSLMGSEEAKAMPLFGIPVTVKDIFCTKGIRTTAASRMLENFVPPFDAHVVSALKKAGAVVVAKTNTDEFAMGTSTETSIFGPSHNPWDTSRVPGGSSGGAAASTVAGQACGAIASDSGGSIRIPAAFCGCVGLKPTYGRVSRYGGVAYASSFDQAGILTRSIKDCALMLEAIAGPDAKDFTCATLPVPAYSKALTRNDLRGVTLGMPKELWEQGADAEIMDACTKAIATARELGATVVEVSLPHIQYSAAAYGILATAEASTNLARFDGVRFGLRADGDKSLNEMYEASRSLGFGLEVKRRIILGTYALSHACYEKLYIQAAKVRRIIHDEFIAALNGCDALISPVTLSVAGPLGAPSGGPQDDPLYAYKMDILASGLNLSGLPGLSMPIGLGRDSAMPIGLQVMGKAFDEAGLLSICAALEPALPALGTPRALA